MSRGPASTTTRAPVAGRTVRSCTGTCGSSSGSRPGTPDVGRRRVAAAGPAVRPADEPRRDRPDDPPVPWTELEPAVHRRFPVRMVRCCRSTNGVPAWAGSGLPTPAGSRAPGGLARGGVRRDDGAGRKGPCGRPGKSAAVPRPGEIPRPRPRTTLAPHRAARPAPAPSPRTPGAMDQPTRPLRVLVVEDYDDGGDSYAALLALLGHIPAVARSCREAEAVAPGFGPDVVLLDVGLPDGDGYGLAGRLRAVLPRPPAFVAVTGLPGAGRGGPGRPGSATTSTSRSTRGCWPGCSAGSRPVVTPRPTGRPDRAGGSTYRPPGPPPVGRPGPAP